MTDKSYHEIMVELAEFMRKTAREDGGSPTVANATIPDLIKAIEANEECAFVLDGRKPN